MTSRHSLPPQNPLNQKARLAGSLTGIKHSTYRHGVGPSAQVAPLVRDNGFGLLSSYIHSKNAGCGLAHDPLSSVKKFQTLSLEEVYYPPLPIYYRGVLYIRKA